MTTPDTYGYHDYLLDDRPLNRFRFSIALRAAAVVWVLYAAVAVVDVFTLGLMFPFTFGFQLLLSGLAGAAAGWGHDRQAYRSGQYGQLGVAAGVLIPIFSSAATILLGLILGFGTVGVTLFSAAFSCLCLPFNLAVGAGAGWLGAKLYQWLFGKGLYVQR